MGQTFYIHENWTNDKPLLMGYLYTNHDKFKDVYSFEFDKKWLSTHESFLLDPDLGFWEGRQYLNSNKPFFGFLSDSCPDRWGRILMDTKEIEVSSRHNRSPKKLSEIDYLMRVDDKTRMGAIRISRKPYGRFLSDNPISSFKNIRELESAAMSFETSEDHFMTNSLNKLLSPGSSLGGARPKASVYDEKNNLWIAKFPSKHDSTNREAWEMVCHDLALDCGIDMPEAKLEKYSKYGSTYLSKRFDRFGHKRIHFSSAMNLLGKTDGDDDGGYLDLAGIITSSGCQPKKDLLQLYKRLVFNMLINNTDDHLQNHGFLLQKNGWSLSPAYDVNPTPFGNQLSLFISPNNKLIEKQSAISICQYFGIENEQALKIFDQSVNIIKANWEKYAKKYQLTNRQISEMQAAFRRCYEK